MTKYPYRMKCTKCGKDFEYKSTHAMLEQSLYDRIADSAICPICKKKQKEQTPPNNFAEFLADLGERDRSEIVQVNTTEQGDSTLPKYEIRKIEIKEDLTMGERLYCVIQDLEDYIMHNNLEKDKELDFIWRQLDTIKEIYDESPM